MATCKFNTPKVGKIPTLTTGEEWRQSTLGSPMTVPDLRAQASQEDLQELLELEAGVDPMYKGGSLESLVQGLREASDFEMRSVGSRTDPRQTQLPMFLQGMEGEGFIPYRPIRGAERNGNFDNKILNEEGYILFDEYEGNVKIIKDILHKYMPNVKFVDIYNINWGDVYKKAGRGETKKGLKKIINELSDTLNKTFTLINKALKNKNFSDEAGAELITDLIFLTPPHRWSGTKFKRTGIGLDPNQPDQTRTKAELVTHGEEQFTSIFNKNIKDRSINDRLSTFFTVLSKKLGIIPDTQKDKITVEHVESIKNREYPLIAGEKPLERWYAIYYNILDNIVNKKNIDSNLIWLEGTLNSFLNRFDTKRKSHKLFTVLGLNYPSFILNSAFKKGKNKIKLIGKGKNRKLYIKEDVFTDLVNEVANDTIFLSLAIENIFKPLLIEDETRRKEAMGKPITLKTKTNEYITLPSLDKILAEGALALGGDITTKMPLSIDFIKDSILSLYEGETKEPSLFPKDLLHEYIREIQKENKKEIKLVEKARRSVIDQHFQDYFYYNALPWLRELHKQAQINNDSFPVKYDGYTLDKMERDLEDLNDKDWNKGKGKIFHRIRDLFFPDVKAKWINYKGENILWSNNSIAYSTFVANWRVQIYEDLGIEVKDLKNKRNVKRINKEVKRLLDIKDQVSLFKKDNIEGIILSIKTMRKE